MAQIQFKGKSFVQNHHLLVKYHELIPKKGESLTDKVSLHDNLIIHGDNLKALKALLPIYAGKVVTVHGFRGSGLRGCGLPSNPPAIPRAIFRSRKVEESKM